MSNTHKDRAGNSYSSPDNKPAQAGTQVKINTQNGPVDGRMVGGYAVTDKKR